MSFARVGYIRCVEYTDVWTDGSCPGNGMNATRGGIGVFFGDNSPMNLSERYDGPTTSSTMEIRAARRGIEIAKRNHIRDLRVNTDSEFLVNSVNDWMKDWKRNGWRKADGSPVVNREEFKALDRVMDGTIDVIFNHVPGHSNNYGNNQADKLARRAAGI